MSNYKGGLTEAKRQFLEDLKDDKDFIEFKKNAKLQYFYTFVRRVHKYQNRNWLQYDKYLSNKSDTIFYGVPTVDTDIFKNNKNIPIWD